VEDDQITWQITREEWICPMILSRLATNVQKKKKRRKRKMILQVLCALSSMTIFYALFDLIVL
jgi:hypothetical protein